MSLESWGSGAAAIGRHDTDRGEPQRRGGMAQMSTLCVHSSSYCFLGAIGNLNIGVASVRVIFVSAQSEVVGG